MLALHEKENSTLPFQKVVSASLRRRFPPELAREGDHVGLTIGALREVERGSSAMIMLCVDLTEHVLAEAVAQRANFIVTYSPISETPLRVLSTDDVIGRIMLKCAEQSLAVHCIHTACDAAAGGMNDWLARSLASGESSPILPHPDLIDAGQGRLLECDHATPLSTLVASLKRLLQLRHVRLAMAAVVDEQSLAKAQECCFVKTIALHVGDRAASVLRGCEANVYITSEMAHAEVLAANAQGVVVLLTGQSTIERAYLRHLRQELEDEFVDSDWNVKVKMSQVDCSPLAIV